MQGQTATNLGKARESDSRIVRINGQGGYSLLRAQLVLDRYLAAGIYKKNSNPMENGIWDIAELLGEDSVWDGFYACRNGDMSHAATLSVCVARGVEELPSYNKYWRACDRAVVSEYLQGYRGKVAEVGKLAGTSHVLVRKCCLAALKEAYSRNAMRVFFSTNSSDAQAYRQIFGAQVFWETLHISEKLNSREVVASVCNLEKPLRNSIKPKGLYGCGD